MVNDDEYQGDIYKLNVTQKLDKRKIFISIAIILLIVCVILTGNNISITVSEYKAYKQYEAQINSIKHQEEEKQAKIAEEKERKRKEKIPQLTDVRKTKYGKNI